MVPFRLVLKKYNLHLQMVINGVFSATFFFLYEIAVSLTCVRYVVPNTHWCTIQWGIVMYYDERDNMQMYYKVCFIFK